MTTAATTPNFVAPRGNQNGPLVFVGYKPTEQDEAKGYVYSDTSGWFLEKLIGEANLPTPFFMTLQPTFKQQIPDELCAIAMFQYLESKRYPFIIPCESSRQKGEKNYSKVLEILCPFTKGDLDKYAGSLLKSPSISWEHYVIPTQSPQFIFENYSEKDIVVSIDYGKIRDEVDYYKRHGRIQPLPERTLITEPTYPELMNFLICNCRKADFLANDIETIRPPKDSKTSKFKGHPGFPYTISLAPSPKLGISFSLWDYDIEQLVRIWRQLDWLMQHIPQIGQNFFVFDTHFLRAMGFSVEMRKCIDTLIRHHILWPELPHKLQFQTRQYTRQPYYKDEGKGWSPKHKQQLMHYNALDTTVDFEIAIAQELEFDERPHLRGEGAFEVRCP